MRVWPALEHPRVLHICLGREHGDVYVAHAKVRGGIAGGHLCRRLPQQASTSVRNLQETRSWLKLSVFWIEGRREEIHG